MLGVGVLVGVRELVRRRVLRTRGHLLAMVAGTARSFVWCIVVDLAGTALALRKR